ncbi:3-methyladenine DNA glycosylase Mpg [Parabacteroides sp. PF5-5]|uniref:DNA-3-methyladenine glycosylase n=1 Tax=unclassified Parabacteroides TaxID=2649774 RepID=UPI002475E560|nr:MULTISPECIES: DNA-3-methyladenine glycosylase [unclassified Parabacteroides]MDH6304054.1 3-methyladenine DNA glycosylase Mpg [Parabacteroides sp. PH5-39]MDH6315143.1 3-methyladenine DNA glycosylase Mpg [Parabacteroides sp. PF5-13]MDH6318891.1 3-methyladenine DNA glycosylase Mpg [Parabacteroides sp. PH5-13]MDH6322620.1 3-methyladenine DNA glycosylase Mpg [Parabacteroides sp. PH5-8]MDH6326331.1 3-methyladenine DNA glycosylase Mpg [Parabacteroides sp. PH5-41]
MIRYFDEIKNLIDKNGTFVGDTETKKTSIQAVEALAKSLLGSTLYIRGNKYIIRMLEIYYGGIGDDAHDWYRTNFIYKKSKYREQTTVQNSKGFRIYLSSNNIDDTYTRFDIVAGHEGVPVSFLIRSVWDSNFDIIGEKNGSPNTILKAMGLNAEDHNKIVEIDDPNSEINIQNTSNEIMNQRKLTVKQQPRINLKSGFEEGNGVLWNFLLE